ncbi:aminodeoxychorismate synthase component I [Acetivibrio cellulolyticus]|uniref:aminodeoxychorismate synthase component I n=1 Tax=Acetivibrio cellulolyticus TaxID=35830 RepID=UPI0002481BAB|nr:aminodeoxychorismate synthase component I [Acetivibrio cellulolyticus]
MEKEISLVEKLNIKYEKEELILSFFAARPNAVILDSSLKSADIGKFTVIAFDPFMVFESKGSTIKINKDIIIHGNPLEILRKYISEYRIENGHKEVPFCGGCIGFFSYDIVNFIEELPKVAIDDLNINDITLGFYNKAIIIDHINGWIYAIGASFGVNSPKEEAARANLDSVKDVLHEIIQIKDAVDYEKMNVKICTNMRSNFSREDYIRTVEKAKEYIRNGDIFQVNLSQRFEMDIHNEPQELYFKLRRNSPAQFSAYLNFEDIQVISTSPERLIKLEGNRIETRPIKGTRPRGRNGEEDFNLKKELMESAKDKAELTMIVDLERNDLGRICEIGSVVVERNAEVEEYANVFHTVSTVSGKIEEDLDIIDCIYAAFPGGSITGAPKIRAMEIIEELEPFKRNIYTGSIGFIGFDGTVDLNIAIRTILIKNNRAYFSVGGGIVWDSDPIKEYEETLHKGEKVLEVLGGGKYDYR